MSEKEQKGQKGLEYIEADLLFYPLDFQDISGLYGLPLQPTEGILKRNLNFGIDIQMKGKASHTNQIMDPKNIPAGTVSDSDTAEAQGKYGRSKIQLMGVIIHRQTTEMGSRTITFQGSIGSVIEAYQTNTSIASSILYLLGFTGLHCSRMSRREIDGTVKLQRQNTPELKHLQTIEKPATGRSTSGAADAILVKTKHGIVLFSRGSENAGASEYSPSYLHFIDGPGVLSQESRRAFLEAICFCFGKRFIEVGFTEFDIENNPIRKSSRSPYSLNLHSEVSQHELSPTMTIRGLAEEDEIGNIVELFLDSREKFNLSKVMWHIWHARMLPVGSELVIYAMAFEALMNAWFKLSENVDRAYYVPEQEFQMTVAPLIETLTSSVGDSTAWKRIFKKMYAANHLSVNDKYKRFFEEIGLKVGAVELEVIGSRHKFAHGGSAEDSEIKRLVVLARAYETLLNRCILKVIGYQGEYVDYSTLRFPRRRLEEPLGGPNNDGKIER